MIVVIGLSLIFLIWSRIGWPQPGFFVSTTVLPPPPLSIHRLSRSFSTSTTRGAAAAGGCWNAPTPSDREPTVTRAARKVIRLMARIIPDLWGAGDWGWGGEGSRAFPLGPSP